MPITLDAEHGNLAEFAESDALDASGVMHLKKCDAVKDVFTPAACYHFYVNFQNETLSQARYVTTCATCFRKETHYVPLRRQWSFYMREVVCLGTSAEVMDYLENFRCRLEKFFTEIGLPIEWKAATDPFFSPRSNPKYLAQRLDPLKTEMVYNGDLAIGSINFHRNYFGEAFNISRDGQDAFSGCVAFGLERWVYTIVNYFGEDPAAWPDFGTWGSP
jgi:seryl-tRNA synthetase